MQEILLSVLKNEPSPFLETTVLNAGLGFYANGKVASIKEGVALARQVIASGKALEKLRHVTGVTKNESGIFIPNLGAEGA